MALPKPTPISEDVAWEDAKAATGPEPVECLRCGRWLHNRLSIMRQFGPSCFVQQALDTISNSPYPAGHPVPPPVVNIVNTSQTTYAIEDKRGNVVGEIAANERGTWNIYAFGKFVDFDANLASAKRRANRIFTGLWS